MSLIYVALGGAAGAVLRYLTGLALAFPYGTLAVNVLGCFAMGAAFVLLAGQGRGMALVMTGMLGGFTTFSAFSLDTLKLYEAGQPAAAAGYVLASLVLSLAALFAAVALTRAVTA